MNKSLHLFEGFGVEIEYMLVGSRSLDVNPMADRIIHRQGHRKNDVDRGDFRWSNELVLHVVEIKGARPFPSLSGLAAGFQEQIAALQRLASDEGNEWRLLPTGMHPWMDPHLETKLWPHDQKEIYDCFDRIFSCQGHGWSNLQSTHLNLPFQGDGEFRRLHSAIRLVLPVIVALSASSPFEQGRFSGNLSQRMHHYARNCRKIPSISGLVVPDVFRSEQEYREMVFDRIEADLASLDPDGILEPEWTNARGAIARFSRQSIEIRVMDAQENPLFDIAILDFVIGLLRALTDGEFSSIETQESVATDSLAALFTDCVHRGLDAGISDRNLLLSLGLNGEDGRTMTVGHAVDLLRHRLGFMDDQTASTIGRILQHGPLARRILDASGPDPVSRQALHRIYSDIAECLVTGRFYQQGEM